MKDPNAEINAIIARRNAQINALNAQRGYPQQPPMRGGGQMYAGGSSNFNERTGQYAPQEQGWLARLISPKYANAAQGAWGNATDWVKNFMPDRNAEWNEWRKRKLEEEMRKGGG